MQSMLEADEVRDPFKCAAVPDIAVDPIDGPGAEVGISIVCLLIEECGANLELSTTVVAEEIETQLSFIRHQLAREVPRVCLANKAAQEAGVLEKFTPPPGLS